MSTAGYPATGPAAAGERIVSLDFIRGIAVMGIVWANVVAFGQPFLGYSWPGGFATAPQAFDEWLWAAQFVVVDGKMRGLFSLLFGASLALFADRAETRGEGEGRQARRLAFLLLFGIAHFYFLWRGEILALYAMCGFVAMFALRCPPIVQFSAGMTAYVAGALCDGLVYGVYWRSGADLNGPDGERADAARELAIAANGTYADYVSHGFEVHRWNWLEGFLFTAPETVPLMLMGSALYRAGLFDGRIDRRRQTRWGWGGVLGGTALTTLLALWTLRGGLTYPDTLFASNGPMALFRLPVVVGAAAVLPLISLTARGWFGARAAAAGRMAFSNYVGTSLLMLLLFQPPGLRLYGALERVPLYLVALAVCSIMLAWSKPWLESFHHGPLEWLWRCLTYGRVFPFRR